jgi:hypothetical protein
MNLPNLYLRSDQAGPLTAIQHDHNWKTVRNFCNALSARIATVLKPNGTLTDGAVGSSDVLADRIVTASKLHYTANLFVVATGVDAYAATLAPGTDFTRGDGVASAMVLHVKFPATNTKIGAEVTLNVNASGAARIVKNGTLDLASGDIVGGRIYQVIWDGSVWQIVGGSKDGEILTSKVKRQSAPFSFPAETLAGDVAAAGVMSYDHGITDPDFAYATLQLSASADPQFGYDPGDKASSNILSRDIEGMDYLQTVDAISTGWDATKSWVKVLPYKDATERNLRIHQKEGDIAEITAEDLVDWKIWLTTVKY